MGRFGHVAFTPRVKAEQERMGSRNAYTFDDFGHTPDRLGDDERTFLAARDSFYLASVGETGWPYVQHRGGPTGFVSVLDAHTIAFADFRGNKQYISLGNVGGDDRVALIFMDYKNRTRLKVLAHASVITAASAPELFAQVAAHACATGADGKSARVERVFVLRVEGLDWNCPQHITPRFTVDDVRESMAPVMAKLDALERENARLRASLAHHDPADTPRRTPREGIEEP